MKYFFYYLIFPGFAFASVMGLLTCWVDRKITARLQWRVGPPWYQNFADILKLMIKETIVPDSANRFMFLFAPLFGLAAAILAATLTGLVNFTPETGFMGDAIVIWYLFAIPAIALIIGSSASGNPLAAIGTSREIKLLLSYELPLVIAFLVPLMKARTLAMEGLIAYQQANGAFMTNASGIIAFIVFLLCIQAKLGLVPFDIPEAETELAGGILIEYSGVPLAIFKLTKAILFFSLPLFIITLFWGGMNFHGFGILWAIIKYVVIILLITVIRNTNPRLRIDQAMKFFWFILTPLAIIALILGYIGA